MTNSYRMAVIAGDGIGKEVVPEGLRVIEAAAAKFDFAVKLDQFDFASCDYYQRHGAMMPEDWKAQIGGHENCRQPLTSIYGGSSGREHSTQFCALPAIEI